MRAEEFAQVLGVEFFTGVPDSQLKALCDYLMDRYGIAPEHHIIAANEGNCTALAAGVSPCNGENTCCVFAKSRTREYYQPGGFAAPWKSLRDPDAFCGRLARRAGCAR